MTANVVRLPTAPQSYITVRGRGDSWEIVLVTPGKPRAIKTTIGTNANRDQAIAHAEKVAAQMMRPFKIDVS